MLLCQSMWPWVHQIAHRDQLIFIAILEERAGCFAWLVLLVSRDGCVALPPSCHGFVCCLRLWYFLIILTYCFCVHKEMLTILREKVTKFVTRCWGLLIVDSRAISCENWWFCSNIRISHVFLNFYLNICADFHKKKSFHVQWGGA